MSKATREAEYPAELETQFIMRLPEEPAKELKDLLRSGDNLKNRLSIEFEPDMRKGEVKFDHRTLHGKVVDLPTVVESLKTIDNKSFYKTADISQMMICKEEPDQTTDEELPTKNKKKDPYKVDKKYLYPHGLTPPTKNVRKRRFRKTLKKKSAEAPEIEKEVKRLLRADNEAESVTFEIISEDDVLLLHPTSEDLILQEPSTSQGGNVKGVKKGKGGRGSKRKNAAPTPKSVTASTSKNSASTSNVVDIFGGAVSDSDLEDTQNEGGPAGYVTRMAEASPSLGPQLGEILPTESLDFDPQLFKLSQELQTKVYASDSYGNPGTSGISFEDQDPSQDSKDSMTARIELAKAELDELKERKKRTQQEIAGMENVTLRQRFEDTLHTLNQEVMYKDMEYLGLLTLQNSEDI